MNCKVLITDFLHPFLAEYLLQIGCEVSVEPEITNQQTLETIHLYNGLVVSTKIKVDAALLNKGINLKFVARAGSGMENIDVDHALSLNIATISSPEGNSNAVAEHAIGMLLSLVRHVSLADHQIRNGIWLREQNRGIELAGKTIGIIGFGNTGSAFAEKLASFNMKILAFDKYRTNFGNAQVHEVSYEQIQSEANFVSLHLPHTHETHHFLNESTIRAFKNPFYLVNTSRGKVVNTKHLIEALAQKKILGACLDVFEDENFYTLAQERQIEMNDLCTRDNVILTPHIAGWTHESYLKIAQILAQKIEFLLTKN